MLVLSRSTGEELVIDGTIVVKVVEVRGGRVRLGITAPRDVPVHRREVYDDIRRRGAIRDDPCATREQG